eukprot:scaffold115222_cov45-Phaeocystis_antarctica.AAC.1
MYVYQNASPLCFAFFLATVIASLIFCVTSSAKSLDCSSPYCQVRVRFQARARARARAIGLGLGFWSVAEHLLAPGAGQSHLVRDRSRVRVGEGLGLGPASGLELGLENG